MANPMHLAILSQGVDIWNRWRRDNPNIPPDLYYLDLANANLTNANLSHANLSEANLDHAKLTNANLSHADLSHANVTHAWLPDADLSNAKLTFTDLTTTDLTNASFRNAQLTRTDLSFADLTGTDFSYALFEYTHLNYLDLSQVKGLDTVHHRAPSLFDIHTLYQSKGQIPEVFLRGIGVPDAFIVFAQSLVAAIQPIQYYSCFISYSSKDQDFADRLYVDLQANNVRSWFAPEDLKIGDKFLDTIHDAIRLHDKLLVILSQTSLASDWVEDEVSKAMEQERRQKRLVLFPITIDDAVWDSTKGWAENMRNIRHIGDFRQWKDYSGYKMALRRLLRDLKAEDKLE